MRPWIETNPERLEFELRALDEAGIPYERDNEAYANGKLSLHLTPTIDGQRIDLIAEFPDFYPYFRFEVRAPNLALARHQHPFNKNLCLIGRATRNWHTTDTLADFILTRVPSVLGLAPDDESLSEEQQGEPATDYFTYAHDSLMVVDSAWVIDPSQPRGQLLLGLEQSDLVRHVRGAVLEVRGQDGALLLSPA